MAVTTRGIAQWGVSSGTKAGSVSGVVTDITIGNRMISEPQRNEVGQVIQQAFYDRNTTVTCTVEVASGTQAPKEGDAITIAGVQGYVESAEIVESNRAFRKIQITAQSWMSCKTVTRVEIQN